MTSVQYGTCLTTGALCSDDDAVADMLEAERIAEDCGDDVALGVAQLARGLVLSRRPEASERDVGLGLLQRARDAQNARGILLSLNALADIGIVRLTAERGDVKRAIADGHALVDFLVEHGEMTARSAAVATLVDVLLRTGKDADLIEAEEQIARLAAVPTDPGFVLNEIWLLRMRALVAQAKGDDARYLDFAARYRDMATSLGFEGHMALAGAMR